MPSICLSSAITAAINSTIFAPGGSTSQLYACYCAQNVMMATYTGYNGPVYGGIRIMKGSLPLSFSEISGINSRSADTLINYTSPGLFTSTSTLNTNPIIVTSFPLTASASGTATWFWAPQGSVAGNYYDTTQYNRFWGTVGLQGSGADLEISDTNIVSGKVYKIINLRLGIPQSYTY